MEKKLIAMIFAVLIMLSLLAGCSRSNEPVNNEEKENIPNQNSVGETEEIATKTSEITLCESWGFENGFATVITPETSTNFGLNFYLANFYETLVNYEDGEILPSLAKSWEVSEDGLIYTFYLKEGVKFSDGADFNAEVVKKNLEMIPRLSGAYNGSVALITALFKEINVIDEYTVEVHMSSPYYGALHDFAKLNPMAMVSPNAFNEDNTLSDKIFTNTMGTGPYMYDSQSDEKIYTFISNPNYHGGKSDIIKFNVKVIPDQEAKALALRKGEIDMIFGFAQISYDGFKVFSDDNNFGTNISDTPIRTRFFGFNLSKEPFNDKNVRLAVNHAIDKENISKNIFYDIEKKADTFFNSELPYCDVELKPYEYNVDKAIQLLEQSGYVDTDGDGIREKDGNKLEGELLYISGSSVTDDLALTVKSFLNKIGMDIKVTGLDMMAWYAKTQADEFAIAGRETYGIPSDPFTSISNMNTQTKVDNILAQALIHLEDGDEIINKLNTLVKENEIQEEYDFILNEIHSNSPFVPISHIKELIVYNSKKIDAYEFDGQPSNIRIDFLKVK